MVTSQVKYYFVGLEWWFVFKRKRYINTGEECHLVMEILIWHMTCDMCPMTRDTQGVVNIVSKCQVPISYSLGVMMCQRFDMWYGKYDMWHVICDVYLWHVTCDLWHMANWVLQTFSQNFRSLALTVWELWCFKDLKWYLGLNVLSG